MRTASAARKATPGFAINATLWLEVLTLAIGVLHFAFVSNTVQQPILVALALALLALNILLARTVTYFSKHLARQYWVSTLTLTLAVTLLAAATGGVHSALVTLYLIPLAVIALAFGRWWLVALLGVVIAALGLVLATLTPGVNIHDIEFSMAMLSRLAPAVAVTCVLAALIERMHSAVQRISDLAATDNLTGLLNLRAFEEVLQQEHRKAERFGRAYTLVVIDVDNLAHVNEQLGHEAGSQVLVAVAAAISRSIRASDVAGRLGGDDFVVLMTEADAATGAVIAQRIRNNVYAGTVSVANRLIRANVSLGTASFPEDHLYPKELLILADQRMQQDRELRRTPAA
ncbi:MAG TPA: GGDEF domain-containing protein [Steroidobacteraceae bacterium]|jgi:diguanylate cyclase (GGDEF)-like protein